MNKKQLLAIVGSIILFIAIYQMLQRGWIWFVNPSSKKYPIRGIDVSHHQGFIEWSQIPKDQITFVYIKATEGADFKDKNFAFNWKEARKENFSVGAYHFFTLCKSGKEQATHFIQVVPKELNSLPPVVDLEWIGKCKDSNIQFNIPNEINDYLNLVDAHYQTKTILYLTYQFIDTYLNGSFFQHPIWIRNIYYHPNTFSSQPWLLWQYKSRERIPGIRGPVDMNVFNGDLERFQKELVATQRNTDAK